MAGAVCGALRHRRYNRTIDTSEPYVALTQVAEADSVAGAVVRAVTTDLGALVTAESFVASATPDRGRI